MYFRFTQNITCKACLYWDVDMEGVPQHVELGGEHDTRDDVDNMVQMYLNQSLVTVVM